MICDPTIEVTCNGDDNRCDDSMVVAPEWVYASRNEASGHYDMSDRALRKLIEAEGWPVAADNKTTYCPAHAPDSGDSNG